MSALTFFGIYYSEIVTGKNNQDEAESQILLKTLFWKNPKGYENGGRGLKLLYTQISNITLIII